MLQDNLLGLECCLKYTSLGWLGCILTAQVFVWTNTWITKSYQKLHDLEDTWLFYLLNNGFLFSGDVKRLFIKIFLCQFINYENSWSLTHRNLLPPYPFWSAKVLTVIFSLSRNGDYLLLNYADVFFFVKSVYSSYCFPLLNDFDSRRKLWWMYTISKG